MKNSFKKTLSLILAFTMIVSGLSVSVLASNTNLEFDMSLENQDSLNTNPNIEEEIISKRTSHSKVFSTEDGGYYTIVSATPIHIIDDDGNYQNIEEPTSELSSEEVISEYVAAEAKLFNSSSNISIYGSNITEDDKYEDDAEFIIKCFGSTSEDTTGNFVQGSSKGNKLVCIKPNIEQHNILVTSAKVNANALGLGTTANNYVIAKKITASWDENTTSKPTIHNNYFDCVSVSKSTMTTAVEWDITHLMNSWHLGLDENNGFALVAKKSGCSVSLSEITMSFYYREIDEIDDDFTYEIIDMGNAGTVYINHFSCVPILQHNDIGIDGEKAPVFISHIYNPLGENTTNAYGDNFRLNYNSILKYTGNGTYTWSTIDGDTVDFNITSTDENIKTFTSKDLNSTFTLQLEKDNIKNNFNYTKYENIIIQNNHTNEKFAFESHSHIGYLNAIDDGSENHNLININYQFIDNETEEQYTSNNISYITDGVGRKYNFNYTIDGNISYLNKIIVTTSDDSSIYVGTGNNREEYIIEYTYQIIDDVPYLTTVNHVGETEEVTYSYDTNNRLSTISNGSKTLNLIYASDASNKLSSYNLKKFFNGSDVLIENVAIDSSKVYERVFTNIDNETCVINYDENYDTVYYKDYDGIIINGINRNGETLYLFDIDNRNNLISNGDFESVDGNQYPSNWVKDNDDAEINIDADEINNNTLQIQGNLFNSVGTYQQINAPDGISFKAKTSYAYGGTAKVDNAIASNDKHTFGIYIFNAIAQGGTLIPNQCISYFNFDHTLHNIEQQKMSYFTLEEDTPALFVYICFDYNYDGENAYFDNIRLFDYEINDQDVIKDPYNYEHNNNNSVILEKYMGTSENGNSYLATLYGYDNSCNLNYLSEITDERGITTYYKYDPDNGRLISATTNSANLNKDAATSFEYTASGLLSSVKQTVKNVITGHSVEMKTDYGYTDGMLSSVTHNGFSYNFEYDVYGNITSIEVNTHETPLVTTTYSNARKCIKDTITYANGCQIDYTYDTEDTDRIIQIDYIKEDGSLFKSLNYNYDTEGNLSSIIDAKAKVKVTYNGNSYSYILTDNETETVLYQSNINESGNIVETFPQGSNGATTTVISTPSLENTIQSEQIESKSEQLLSRVESVDGVDKNINYSFDKSSITDEFDRLQSSKINSVYQIGSDSFAVNSEDTYTYKSNGDREFTLVDSYTTVKSIGERNENGTLKYNNGEIVTSDHYNFTFNYSYDSSGNITKVHLTDNVNNTFVNFLYSAYKYDNANQLIFEYSPTKNCCIAYDYDAGGNIIEKRVYNLSAYDQTNDTILSSAQYESIVFSYDPNYKDRLISVNNAPIQYDSLGNPINYDPANGFFEWNGRLLTAFETNNAGNRYEYEYDEQGLRVRKIIYDKKLVAGTTDEYTYEKTNSLEYIWDNGKLKGVSFTNTQTNTSSFMNLIYDEAGIAQGYIGLSGNPYYFVRDALGNVVYVISPIDDLSITVFYDAWGNPTLQSSSYDDIGMQIATLFIYYFNPSTYKGYLYDYETGLYYCQSRYYSPVWSRFINMDDVRILNLTQGDTLGNNLYAYCNNNPVNYIDTTGYWAEKYPGFEWTNNGFKLSVHPNFLKKSFCLEYAADILAIVKSNKYKSMSQKRMAVELYFHAAIYYIMDPFVVLGLNGALINKLHTSAKMMDINNNDYRVVFFYLVWNSL